jgi:hypothetical protein
VAYYFARIADAGAGLLAAVWPAAATHRRLFVRYQRGCAGDIMHMRAA